ncbi:MAG: ribosome biogenesis GTP-binding protein YihA/YsxC [Actinomycetota bacterium]
MKPPIARFITSAAHADSFPREGPPEFAFLGRSNVGKSSLINSLLGQRIAHVSSTPGRTRTINFIGIYSSATQPEPQFMLVDLPGYGYAKISRSISAEWPKFIEPYLEKRATLQSSIVLVDVNVPPQPPDRQLIDYLQHTGRDFMLVGTKSDKLSGNKLKAALSALEEAHGVDSILPYSARTGAGRTALWHAISERAEAAQQISRRM